MTGYISKTFKFEIEVEIDCEVRTWGEVAPEESEIVEHIWKALQPHPHLITKDFENVKVSTQWARGQQ